MTLSQRILLGLSRSPESSDYYLGESGWSSDNSLSLLEGAFEDFGSLVSGKKVVDFGCGAGHQSIALARKYHCYVVGIDTNRRTLEGAMGLAKSLNIPESTLTFVDSVSDPMSNSFDVVISQNSFEHFDDPQKILDQMRGLINESGKILITGTCQGV